MSSGTLGQELDLQPMGAECCPRYQRIRSERPLWGRSAFPRAAIRSGSDPFPSKTISGSGSADQSRGWATPCFAWMAACCIAAWNF